MRPREPRRWRRVGATIPALLAGLALPHHGGALPARQGGDPSLPRVTLLYQNFPNPFPTPASTATCVWFDLHQPSRVRLTIHDIRGTTLRTLVPSPEVGESMPAGRHGRGTSAAPPGCDWRFTWDGTADGGRVLPPGVYLMRLRAGAHESFKRIVFRGR